MAQRKKIIHEHITLPAPKDRPYIFATFVTTVDGIAKVTDSPSYWPIGSEVDFETFIGLRRYADVILHGKGTAIEVRTVDTIAKQGLNKGRERPLLYAVISNHPDTSLVRALENPGDTKTMIVTSETAVVPSEVEQITEIVRVGKNAVDLPAFVALLWDRGYRYVDNEGGPHLMQGFFAADLIDELFLTLAPKIYGHGGNAMTMVEGGVLPILKAKQLELVSVEQVANELYLRYIVKRE